MRLAVLLFFLSLLGAPLGAQSERRELHVDDVLELVRAPSLSPAARAAAIQRRCVAFRLNERATAQLRDAGADTALLNVIRSACFVEPIAPLRLFYHDGHADNVTAGTRETSDAATAAGYRFARIEGALLNAPDPGTVPLKVFYHAGRRDYLTTTTRERAALDAGYVFVRVDGWVFMSQVPETVPLKLYWNGQRQDHFLASSAQGDRDALAAGYQLLGIEGYVFPSP